MLKAALNLAARGQVKRPSQAAARADQVEVEQLALLMVRRGQQARRAIQRLAGRARVGVRTMLAAAAVVGETRVVLVGRRMAMVMRDRQGRPSTPGAAGYLSL